MAGLIGSSGFVASRLRVDQLFGQRPLTRRDLRHVLQGVQQRVVVACDRFVIIGSRAAQIGGQGAAAEDRQADRRPDAARERGGIDELDEPERLRSAKPTRLTLG